MPAALVEKIKKSRTFNQGYKTTEYLAAALLDMAWHNLTADAAPQDVNVFEPAALRRFQVDMAAVPPRYHSTYFAHIWGGGYSAGYYAYLWSEVIEDDAFYWFKEQGGMSRRNGQRFRDMILSRGLPPAKAAEQVKLLVPFAGDDPVPGAVIAPAGFRILTPRRR